MKRWLTAGLMASILATAAWAVIGPDSIWQNTVVDKHRTTQAHGALTAWDNLPLGARQPWIFVHGLHQENDTIDGMLPEDARKLFQLPMTNFQAIYREDFHRELLARVKPFLFTYNSERDDDDIARDLNALIEGNSELTGARVTLVFLVHSKGGCVTYNYVVHYGNRKFLRGVPLGSPLIGTVAAERDEMEWASKKFYPLFGKKLMAVIEGGLNFDAPGVRWLQRNNPGLMQLHQTLPLDERWRLYAGKITPSSKNFIARNLQLALLADSVFIARLGNEGDFYLPLCARLIDQAGGGASDGLVPVDSAQAKGYIKGALTRLEEDCNHYELLQGKQGDLALHRQILYDLLTFVPGQAPAEFKLDAWLPVVPMIDLPQLAESRLTEARVVWVDGRGQLQIANQGGTDVRTLPLSGQFSWPSWDGDDIVAGREQIGSSDIVRIQSDGRIMRLTTNGTSTLPYAADGQLVYIDNGRLILRDQSGAAAIIVADPLDLVSPPVMFGDKIYFAHQTAGKIDLYWISTVHRHAQLSDAKRVMTDIIRPIKIGNFLLGLSQTGEIKAVLGGFLGLTGMGLPASVKASRKLIPGQVELDVDDLTGELYLVADGQVRYLNGSMLANYAPDWAKELTAATLEKREATLVIPLLDELVLVLGPGSQLDVK
ncbi:TPA: hypothetical protein DHW58_00930 [Patescibacteria group bacterium]|nr:hypothetical protein [Patescibacteria group bacterium]